MAEKINPEYADWLLYNVWHEFYNADLFFGEDKQMYDCCIEAARAYYKAWSHYTGIDFKYGFWDLDKFSPKDFEDFNLD